MNNCVKTDPNKRFSLSQVLHQFLIMNPCRIDEFQKISLSLLLLDRLEIIQDQYIGEKMYKCQYQGNSLFFQKFQITTQNQQVAFRQILQCMRFIRNVIHLQEKCLYNVARFYNYQSNIQENGFGKSIFFDIFWMDKEYHIDYLKYPQQLISLLRKIKEINQEGIFMMALDQQFLYENNNIDAPVLFNFLYSQREQDDIQKNLYGWQLKNQNNQYVQQTRILDEVDLIKAYLRKVIKQFNDKNDACQLKQIVLELIDKEEQFLTIRSIINHLTIRKIEIIQNSPIYSDRSDINDLCQIAYQKFVPLDPELHDIIQKFLISSRRYKIESGELNNGMKIYKQKIGSGGHAKVRKINFQGKDYAQKISTISYSDIPQQGDIDLLKSRLNEINIICQIEDHKIPYILQNIHIGFVFKQEEDISRIEIYNLTPIYRTFSIIQESNDLKLKIQFAEKIAVSSKQLENNNISHQNVQPDNIQVDDKLDPVINGFEVSIYNFKTSENHKQLDTLIQTDPELVLNRIMSRKNDVYSFGITIYELFTNSIPIYQKAIEFLLIPSHLDQIVLIEQREIQQLIINCTLKESRIRFSLTQVLYQFLSIHPCRRVFMVILRVLMDQFEDIEITEQEYDLIKEFQEISLQIPLMDSDDIQLVSQLNDNLYKCQYQDNQLLVQQYKILLQDKQCAFRQILQCMRFVRNLVNLNKKNLKNIAQFYNFRLFLQDQDQLIQFEIFMFDSNYQKGYLKTPIQIISLLNTIQQLNETGLFMMEFQDQFMLYQNDNPIIINFLQSFRQQDDLYKNQYGWHINNGQQQLELNTGFQLQVIRNQFQRLYNHIHRQSKVNESNKLFKQILKQILEKFSDYTNISQIVAEILIQKQFIKKPQLNQ